MLRVFEIVEPATPEEASQFLAEHGFDAAVYAGGTELLVLMKEGLVHYPYLVNIKTIPGLDHIKLDPTGQSLHLGALATHRRLERSPLVREYAPLLAEVEQQVANIRVRTAGTIGGNLAFAEPHSDPGTLLLAWGATIGLISAEGRREVPIDHFFTGFLETARRPEEILCDIQLPLLSARTTGAYEKFSTHERPTANVAALLELQNGVIESARIAVGSVGPVPIRATAAEALLRGHRPEPDAFASAAGSAAQAIDPLDDIYGSADYKRHLTQVLTVRALTAAARRAQRAQRVQQNGAA
jgi:carbon-monoxide dehydrogenase medium subunit